MNLDCRPLKACLSCGLIDIFLIFTGVNKCYHKLAILLKKDIDRTLVQSYVDKLQTCIYIWLNNEIQDPC